MTARAPTTYCTVTTLYTCSNRVTHASHPLSRIITLKVHAFFSSSYPIDAHMQAKTPTLTAPAPATSGTTRPRRLRPPRRRRRPRLRLRRRWERTDSADLRTITTARSPRRPRAAGVATRGRARCRWPPRRFRTLSPGPRRPSRSLSNSKPRKARRPRMRKKVGRASDNCASQSGFPYRSSRSLSRF